MKQQDARSGNTPDEANPPPVVVHPSSSTPKGVIRIQPDETGSAAWGLPYVAAHCGVPLPESDAA